MVVQHNLTAMNANRYFGINNSKLSKSLEKLSSGYAINRAGDNAAGLAVSEKMRSQIAGMTQGVKNAQDGISMVQTFEGALTETDNILQRMKTLADQAAHGTYQDEVDREAIQLEFNQLNDELNQIADTDFNGVVLLNGGQMADGLKAVDGKFDYANKADQVASANAEELIKLQEEAQKKIDAATKAVADAQSRLNNTKVDLSNNGAASEWNTVDNNNYGETEAGYVFGTKGDTNGILDADGKNLADRGATSVDVTFTYDAAAKEWKATDASALDANGDRIKFGSSSFNNLKTEVVKGNNNASGLGGFKVKGGTNGNSDTNVNAIFDASNAKDGDTVTLTFTNTASAKTAPKNVGMDADSLESTVVGGPDAKSNPTIALDTNVVDSNMDKTMAEALKKLNDAKVRFEYNGTIATGKVVDENGVEVEGFTVTVTTDATGGATTDNYAITYEDEEGNQVALATGKIGKGNAKSAGSATAKAADNSLKGKTAVYDGTKWVDSADGTTDLSTGVGNAVTVTGPQKGDKMTFDATGAFTGYEQVEAAGGYVEFGVAVDSFNYSEDGGYTVKAGKDKNINSELAVAAQNALDKAKAELEAAQAAYPTELPQGVSKSDAFDNSTAKLTYTDHLIMQVGARSKDAVDFTFSYASEGLGELKANMNCSARADGLGTADLSLLTADSANAAIDKIDNAINKVSMVRATFGATQNRLEHKIDNMNVTIENLTSAESRIRDTNMAEEMMNFTKQQILSQASQSMLAQANQLPQSVLQLLQ